MASVGLDQQMNFYDVKNRIKVQTIIASEPLKSIAFNTDGYTIAVGTQGKSGNIFIYDLRASPTTPFATLTGHNSTVNSLLFKLADPVPAGGLPKMPETMQKMNYD